MKRRNERRKIKGKSMIMEKTIARQNIVDAVTTMLFALSIVDDDKKITNIQFSDLFGASTTEFCKIKIFIEEEV